MMRQCKILVLSLDYLQNNNHYQDPTHICLRVLVFVFTNVQQILSNQEVLIYIYFCLFVVESVNGKYIPTKCTWDIFYDQWMRQNNYTCI